MQPCRTTGAADAARRIHHRPTLWRRTALCLTLMLAGAVHAGPALDLDEAERLALAADPAVVASRARADALREQAVADGQLPDPKLGIGLYNLPLDDFSLKSQPTTQFRTKIQQAFPRGATLRYRRLGAEWMSRAQQAETLLVRRQVRRDLRQTFLELYYQRQAADIIERTRVLFEQLVEITRSHFAAGRVSQQDVLQAQLELSRLDDRATRIDEMADVQRARLTRWIGDDAYRPLAPDFPSLPPLPPLSALQAALPDHPAIVAASARVQASQQQVRVAREQYKPGWNVGVEYRKRFGEDPGGGDRADMMAAMLTVDLPLFTDKRQDKRLSASQQQAEAARQLREKRLRELRRMLESDYARWSRLGEQERLYSDRLVGEAVDSASAALNSYQSGINEFTTLMRARITELDVKLQELRVRVDRAKAHARLLFLLAEADEPALPAQGEHE